MFIMFFHPFIISLPDRFFISIIHSGAGVAMVRLRIVLSGGVGSMHHPYTISLSHILFYLSPLQKLIHERVCTFVCSSFNHLQTHSKVPHSPPLAHATCRPATCSFRRSPTHSIQWPMHSPIYSCIGCIDLLTRSPTHLFTHACAVSARLSILFWPDFSFHIHRCNFFEKECGHFGVAEFWPHRTSVTSPVSHVACLSQNWHGTSRVSDIIDRSQAHFISHNNHITHRSHHPQTFANTVPSHTHNTRIPSHITHISRHTSFTSRVISNAQISTRNAQLCQHTYIKSPLTWLWSCARIPAGSPFRAQGVEPTLRQNHFKIKVQKSLNWYCL